MHGARKTRGGEVSGRHHSTWSGEGSWRAAADPAKRSATMVRYAPPLSICGTSFEDTAAAGSRMERADFTFFHTLRVRWAEVDRQDVVFNGNYFLYFDVAITEYWRAIGFDYPDDIVEKFGTDIFA